MSIQETDPASTSDRRLSTIEQLRETLGSRPSPVRHGRPAMRIFLHWARRAHLYLGLFLLPWAVLYGITGFLFNHPTVFSDQQSQSFSRRDWSGTPLMQPLSPSAMAQDVVDALKKRSSNASNYRLVHADQAAFVRELASASVKADGRKITIFLDVLGRGGIVYSSSAEEAPALSPAPFAMGQSRGGRKPPKSEGMKGSSDGSASSDALILDNPLSERMRQSIPTLLGNLGYPTGEVSIGSIPDLLFHLEADGKTWEARYNPLNGSLAGRPFEAPVEKLSVRRFLTKMHTAHGYTYSVGARWVWAVFVDLMAGVMLFWGGSGLLMWWQIKMTRGWGWLVLVMSLVIAGLLTLGMWSALSAG